MTLKHGTRAGNPVAEAIRQLAQSLRTQADALATLAEAGSDAGATEEDSLVAFPFGLERKAASALVKKGDLRARRIGRKLYARRRDVTALVDASPAEGSAPQPPPTDAYASVVAAAKGRKPARGAR